MEKFIFMNVLYYTEIVLQIIRIKHKMKYCTLQYIYLYFAIRTQLCFYAKYNNLIETVFVIYPEYRDKIPSYLWS